MFCKICGKEIEIGSRFCMHCGASLLCDNKSTDSQEQNNSPGCVDSQENYTTTKESLSTPPGEEEERNGCVTKVLMVFLLAIVISIVLFVLFSAEMDNHSSSGSSSNNSSIGSILGTNKRKATNNDILITFVVDKRIFENDRYYIKVQAQEEIEDLVVRIYFYNKDGKQLKTQDVSMGKVVPGNHYEFELTQSGMNPNDLDTTAKSSHSVLSGTVKEK